MTKPFGLLYCEANYFKAPMKGPFLFLLAFLTMEW